MPTSVAAAEISWIYWCLLNCSCFVLILSVYM